MDAHRFDDLTRSLTSARSRRGLLRLGVGAALAAVLGRPEPAEAGTRCPRGKERCGGKCRAKCPDVKVRNRRTCRCECPDGMRACGAVCVGDDRCCPGEKECGGGCIAEDVCCPYTEKECPDGSCLAKDAGACCPGVEEACASAPGGCCNSLAGEECSADGCCDTLVEGKAVCGGRCVDTKTDANNCGGCGTKCAAEIEVCRQGTCRHFCTLNSTNTVGCGGDRRATAFCCPPEKGCCGDRCCP